MASTTKPQIRLRVATVADVDRLVDLFFTAFALDPGNKLMYPNEVSASAREKFASRMLSSNAAPTGPGRGPNGQHPKAAEVFVVVAELTAPHEPEGKCGEIVAFARWMWNKDPREEWDWDYSPDLTLETMGEGVNLEAANAFIGGLKRLERKHARGDPNIVLSLLATDPTRRGLGAGSALVRWGLELANKQQLPVYLEATPKGYPVYRKLGFEDLDVQDLPIKELWDAVDDGEDLGVNSAVELAGPLPARTLRSVLMRRLLRKPEEQ